MPPQSENESATMSEAKPTEKASSLQTHAMGFAMLKTMITGHFPPNLEFISTIMQFLDSPNEIVLLQFSNDSEGLRKKSEDVKRTSIKLTNLLLTFVKLPPSNWIIKFVSDWADNVKFGQLAAVELAERGITPPPVSAGVDIIDACREITGRMSSSEVAHQQRKKKQVQYVKELRDYMTLLSQTLARIEAAWTAAQDTEMKQPTPAQGVEMT